MNLDPTSETIDPNSENTINSYREQVLKSFEIMLNAISEADWKIRNIPKPTIKQISLPVDEHVQRSFGQNGFELTIGDNKVTIVYTGFTIDQINTPGVIDEGFVDLNLSLTTLCNELKHEVVILGDYSQGMTRKGLLELSKYSNASQSLLNRPELLLEVVDIFGNRWLKSLADSFMSFINSKLIFTSFHIGFNEINLEEMLTIIDEIHKRLKKDKEQ